MMIICLAQILGPWRVDARSLAESGSSGSLALTDISPRVGR